MLCRRTHRTNLLPRARRMQSPARVVIGAVVVWVCAAPPASAQSVELTALTVERRGGELTLDFAARPHLSRTMEHAMERGVPVYFVAEAALYRPRWYWRDERVARVRRTWRIAFQPLTDNWRVGLGAISQSASTLAEALAMASGASGWNLVELDRLDADADYYLEFSYSLDTSRLPSPMQIDLTGTSDWALRVERRVALPEPS